MRREIQTSKIEFILLRHISDIKAIERFDAPLKKFNFTLCGIDFKGDMSRAMFFRNLKIPNEGVCKKCVEALK